MLVWVGVFVFGPTFREGLGFVLKGFRVGLGFVLKGVGGFRVL